MTTLFEIPIAAKPKEPFTLTGEEKPRKKLKPAINYNQLCITEPLTFGKKSGENAHGHVDVASATHLV